MLMTATRTIARPAPEVFEFFADASNNPAWQKGMQGCEWTTPGPIGVGSVYRQTASFLGRPVISVFEVTEFEPGFKIRIETVESTFPIQVTRTVTPINAERCEVSAHITGEPPGPKWLTPLAGKIAQRSVDADYDRLVTLLES